MKNRSKSDFYWMLRHYWHWPKMYHHCAKQKNIERIKYTIYNIKDRKRISKRDIEVIYLSLKDQVKQIVYLVLYLQPLRCNGNDGGWRTKLCDWLEEKARGYEELADQDEYLEEVYHYSEDL